MISGSYWSRNAWHTEIYNFDFIENYRCFGTLNQFYLENPINLIKSSKTSVILDKTEVVDLCVPSISRPVAPRDHFLNAGL